MTPESHIDGLLAALLPGGVFPDVAPQGTPVPYITYQAVGGDPINFLTGEAPDKANTRMQVNVWAATRLEASQLGAQVEAAVRAAAHLQPEILTGRVATYDEQTDYRGTMQDFNLFC
jgi:hypothetical protein